MGFLTKKLLPVIMLSMLLFGAASAQPAAGYAGQPAVRVGIWREVANLMVGAGTEFDLINNYEMKVLKHFSAADKAVISLDKNGLVINGKSYANVRSILVRSKSDGNNSYIEVNKQHYRGNVEIHPTTGKNGLTAVNTLPLEQYLYGTIGREISAEWPLEAVKAQAVAARSFALYNLNKYQDDGYDLCATTNCQVYGGLDSETLTGNQAVNSTTGLVMLFNGEPIAAYYHSSSGGYTEDSENVWGANLPYLRGVADFDQASPYYKWQKEFTLPELETILENNGYRIGFLSAIELSPLAKPPVESSDRGVSGRVKYLTLIGSQGSVRLTGAKLRNLLALNSTLFDIQVVSPAINSDEFEITDSNGDRAKKSVEINLPPAPERGFLLDRANVRHLTNRKAAIVFAGAGFGHGVGMSQWGARAMAVKNAKADSAYFETILKHYYQGVEIKKVY